MNTAVIGAGFGDEGKGLVTDMLCMDGRCAVVRHNGGAQAGHTVTMGEKRYVFHQLGSGSFRHADTIWGESFLPDMFKLGGEAEEFRALSGYVPKIYACSETCVTIIDDVLINMALETRRGDLRHGSCGMGINEAVIRKERGFGITVGELFEMTGSELLGRLRGIRENYTRERLEQLGLEISDIGEYGELLESGEVLKNAAEEMLKNTAYVKLLDTDAALGGYDHIVFEGAQGLLLDSENEDYAPHVTASRTGLDEPLGFCARHVLKLDRAVYVTRSYLTRHGAGPLENECPRERLGSIGTDRTNMANPWQGEIRYAPHGSVESLTAAIKRDLCRDIRPAAFLCVTHLNESGGALITANGSIPIDALAGDERVAEIFDGIYASYSVFADDITLNTTAKD